MKKFIALLLMSGCIYSVKAQVDTTRNINKTPKKADGLYPNGSSPTTTPTYTTGIDPPVTPTQPTYPNSTNQPNTPNNTTSPGSTQPNTYPNGTNQPTTPATPTVTPVPPYKKGNKASRTEGSKK